MKEGWMELLLLLERNALGGEELGQSLLVDILRQTRPQLAIHLMKAADDIIGRCDELLALGFRDGIHPFGFLREHVFELCRCHIVCFYLLG